MAKVLPGNSRGKASVSAEVHPHQWALSLWARGFRRLANPFVVARHVRRLCNPFTVEGAERFSQLNGPAIIVANHTSHFDTLIVLSLLPSHLYSRTAVAAAADRFYREKVKGAWFSLRYNAFPIARGGGSAALDYSEWLLEHGWSLLIFPEGTRSRSGELLPFHPGPAILALRQGVPVLPVSIQGASNILPPGNRWAQPAAVQARVGEPITFSEQESVADAIAKMESAMRDLAQQPAVS